VNSGAIPSRGHMDLFHRQMKFLLRRDFSRRSIGVSIMLRGVLENFRENLLMEQASHLRVSIRK
jgi:hypothetical protein